MTEANFKRGEEAREIEGFNELFFKTLTEAIVTCRFVLVKVVKETKSPPWRLGNSCFKKEIGEDCSPTLEGIFAMIPAFVLVRWKRETLPTMKGR